MFKVLIFYDRLINKLSVNNNQHICSIYYVPRRCITILHILSHMAKKGRGRIWIQASVLTSPVYSVSMSFVRIPSTNGKGDDELANLGSRLLNVVKSQGQCPLGNPVSLWSSLEKIPPYCLGATLLVIILENHDKLLKATQLCIP